MARSGLRAVLPLCGEVTTFPKNSATVESSSKISPCLNANPRLFVIAWFLLIGQDTSLECLPCSFQTKGAFSRKLGLSLVSVSRVLKADYSQLKSCRQKLAPQFMSLAYWTSPPWEEELLPCRLWSSALVSGLFHAWVQHGVGEVGVKHWVGFS